MKIRLRDLFATLLVLAVAVPYIWYLVTGTMPTSIGDFGGLAFVGLTLGTAAFLVQSKGDRLDRRARLEEVIAAVAFAIGILALVLSEAAVAEVVLVVFLGSILVVWALEMADHAGVAHWHARAQKVRTRA